MSLLKCEMWPNAFLTVIQDSSPQTCKAGCNNLHFHSSAGDFTENNWLKKSSNQSIHFPLQRYYSFHKDGRKTKSYHEISVWQQQWTQQLQYKLLLVLQESLVLTRIKMRLSFLVTMASAQP